MAGFVKNNSLNQKSARRTHYKVRPLQKQLINLGCFCFITNTTPLTNYLPIYKLIMTSAFRINQTRFPLAFMRMGYKSYPGLRTWPEKVLAPNSPPSGLNEKPKSLLKICYKILRYFPHALGKENKFSFLSLYDAK